MPGACAVLVAQHFLPLNVVAAQRALRLARALLTRYGRLYVVCGDHRGLDEAMLDREYGRDVLDHPGLVRLDAAPILTRYGIGTAASPIQRVVGGAATRAFCSPGVDWMPALGRALRRIPQGEPVRVVLATGPPFIPFATVIRWAARRPAPAILDYRDLWTANPHARYPRLARFLVSRLVERRLNRSAAMLTTVSEGCASALAAHVGHAPIRVVYNAPDRAYLAHYLTIVDEAAAARQVVKGAAAATGMAAGRAADDGGRDGAGPLRVVYTGQVYPGCTFAPLLRALAGLAPDVSRQVDVHYYGASSALVRREFQQFNMTGRLIDHGQVSKDASLRAVRDADLLVSLIHTDQVSASPAVTGLMTTKVFDYLLSGNPILNIGPANAEVIGFAARVGHRGLHNFTADDVAGLGAFLLRALAEAPSMKTEPLSVALPDFDDQLNAVLDEAEAVGPVVRP